MDGRIYVAPAGTRLPENGEMDDEWVDVTETAEIRPSVFDVAPETREQRRHRARTAKRAAAEAAVPRPTLPNAREWFDIYMRHAGQIPDEVAAE